MKLKSAIDFDDSTHLACLQYISDQMRGMGWSVETVSHEQNTVLGKRVAFHNVVATLDPQAPRRLVLACHYDSLIKPSKDMRNTGLG